MSKRTLVIGLIVLVAALGTWRYVAGRVDRSKPASVATAFFAALKSNNVDKASGYWVPDAAEAWRVSTEEKIDRMQSGSLERFFEDLPDRRAVFASTRKASAPADQETMTANGASVDMRQIDGKWYVCKAPL